LGRGSVDVHGSGGGGQFAELGEWEIMEGADAKEVEAVVEARRCSARHQWSARLRRAMAENRALKTENNGPRTESTVQVGTNTGVEDGEYKHKAREGKHTVEDNQHGVRVENAGLKAEASGLKEGLQARRTGVAIVETEKAGLKAVLEIMTAERRALRMEVATLCGGGGRQRPVQAKSVAVTPTGAKPAASEQGPARPASAARLVARPAEGGSPSPTGGAKAVLRNGTEREGLTEGVRGEDGCGNT
jgi:hypothetical protein